MPFLTAVTKCLRNSSLTEDGFIVAHQWKGQSIMVVKAWYLGLRVERWSLQHSLFFQRSVRRVGLCWKWSRL